MSDNKKVEKKGIIHYLCIGLVILLTCIILCGIWVVFLKPAIPRTKTNFNTYEAFREETFDFFPDRLPVSAHDIKYYSYSGDFDNSYGVSFSLESQDYTSLQAQYEEWYKKETADINWEETHINEKLTNQFSKDAYFSTLESLAHEDINNYQIICYIRSICDGISTSFIILGNEQTYNMIVFYSRDAFYK